MKKDVHTEHCCLVHGCKYGDSDCTVVAKIAPQSYVCEICGMDDISSLNELKLRHPEVFGMSKRYELIIQADENDADYVTSINEIDEETLELIKPLIEAIKNFKPYTTTGTTKYTKDYTSTHRHNYPSGDSCRRDLGEKTPEEYYGFSEEVMDTFNDLCPYGQYGIHTIVSITVSPLVERTVLL